MAADRSRNARILWKPEVNYLGHKGSPIVPNVRHQSSPRPYLIEQNFHSTRTYISWVSTLICSAVRRILWLSSIPKLCCVVRERSEICRMFHSKQLSLCSLLDGRPKNRLAITAKMDNCLKLNITHQLTHFQYNNILV